MDHYFTVNNSTDYKVFLPINLVLKDGNNPPAAATASDHPYYFNSKNKHNIPHYNQSHPALQMANIPRAGVGDNHPHYNPATGIAYGHSSGKGSGPHRQFSHHYEPIPGLPDQSDPYNQQHQQNPRSDQINPHSLEKGSMILYGDPPRPGMIKWIGYLPESNVLTAGVELVSTHLR